MRRRRKFKIERRQRRRRACTALVGLECPDCETGVTEKQVRVYSEQGYACLQ